MPSTRPAIYFIGVSDPPAGSLMTALAILMSRGTVLRPLKTGFVYCVLYKCTVVYSYLMGLEINRGFSFLARYPGFTSAADRISFTPKRKGFLSIFFLPLF